MTRRNKNSRVPRILEMYGNGIQQSRIASELGISDGAVSLAIRREREIMGGWDCYIDEIPAPHRAHLIEQAKASGVRPSTMARAFLIDAIWDAIINQTDRQKNVHSEKVTQ